MARKVIIREAGLTPVLDIVWGRALFFGTLYVANLCLARARLTFALLPTTFDDLIASWGGRTLLGCTQRAGGS
jgi:hypothetical protein